MVLTALAAHCEYAVCSRSTTAHLVFTFIWCTYSSLLCQTKPSSQMHKDRSTHNLWGSAARISLQHGMAHVAMSPACTLHCPPYYWNSILHTYFLPWTLAPIGTNSDYQCGDSLLNMYARKLWLEVWVNEYSLSHHHLQLLNATTIMKQSSLWQDQWANSQAAMATQHHAGCLHHQLQQNLISLLYAKAEHAQNGWLAVISFQQLFLLIQHSYKWPLWLLQIVSCFVSQCR